jgi:aminomethyltransferase
MAQIPPALKKTALAEAHIALGAKMVDFSGWFMPVSYTSVLKEHSAVRTAVGLFDVSHMGEARVSGPGARDFLQYVTINNIDRLSIGGGQYSAMLNENGGFVDDLIVYRVGENEYFLCLNASNAQKDVDWLKRLSGDFKVTVSDESNLWSQIAVQGPKSKECLLAAFPDLASSPFDSMNYMTIMQTQTLGLSAYIARTGYTGEHGYEIYLPNSIAEKVWNQLLNAKIPSSSNAVACGLGARDTLRLEACYLLYGNDMDEHVNPIEAGIKWAVKVNGPDFIGKNKISGDISVGPSRKIFAFTMADDGIPRHGMDVFKDDHRIGTVTSGSVLPTVGGAGGMALLQCQNLKLGDQIEIDVRGKRKLARIARRPLYTANVN